jgi:hypothetical protein
MLAILGFPPVGNALILPLESRFPPWDAAGGAPDGIIVLGGVIDASSPGNQITLNEGAERLAVVPDLARRYPARRVGSNKRPRIPIKIVTLDGNAVGRQHLSDRMS